MSPGQTPSQSGGDVFERHVRLAERLFRGDLSEDGSGKPRLALEVLVSAIQWAPLAQVHHAHEFLVERILPAVWRDDPASGDDAAEDLARSIRQVLEQIRNLVRTTRETEPGHSDLSNLEHLAESAGHWSERVSGGSLAPPESLPPGVVNALYVSPDGRRAICRRLWLRAVPRDERQAEPVPVRGSSPIRPDSFASVNRFLEGEGYRTLSGDTVECLTEGHLGDIKGRSMELAFAVAAVSRASGEPVRPEVAFTGELEFGQGPARRLEVHDVEAVRTKATAASAAGVKRVFHPSSVNITPEERDALAPLELTAVDSMKQVLGQIWKGWSFPADPPARLPLRALLRALVTPWKALGEGAMPFERWMVWGMGLLVFERTILDEHFVEAADRFGDEVVKPPFLVALALSLAAAILFGLTIRALALLPAVSRSEQWLPNWWSAAIVLMLVAVPCGILISMASAGPTLTSPWRPTNILNMFKDIGTYYLFSALYILSFSYMVRAAEELTRRKRFTWSAAVLERRMAPATSFVLIDVRVLIVIAALAFVLMFGYDEFNLLHLDKQPPAHLAHVHLRALLFVGVAAAAINWFHSRRSSLLRV